MMGVGRRVSSNSKSNHSESVAKDSTPTPEGCGGPRDAAIRCGRLTGADGLQHANSTDSVDYVIGYKVDLYVAVRKSPRVPAGLAVVVMRWLSIYPSSSALNPKDDYGGYYLPPDLACPGRIAAEFTIIATCPLRRQLLLYNCCCCNTYVAQTLTNSID